MKKKIISVIVGVAGLTMAYFLASGISHIIYNRPTDNAAAETESTTDSAVQGTEEAKSAMTEDEINEMLAGMKTTETAETETATEEQSEVIPVKFEEPYPVRILIIRSCSMHPTILIISCIISTVPMDIPVVSTPRI